jgi:hypothetical protein
VFRGTTQLVAVPLGGTFGGWKVVEVGQGEAAVKLMGRTVRLQAGIPSAPGPGAPTPAAPTPGAQAVAPHGFTTFSSPPALPPRVVAPPIAASEVRVVPIAGGRTIGDGVSPSGPAPNSQDLDSTTSDALPVLPDTPLGPDGKPIPIRSDSALSEPAGTPDAVAPVHQAELNGYRPFRRLASLPGEPAPAPLLPLRAESAVQGAHAAHAVKTHTIRKRAHHRFRGFRSHHRHSRWSSHRIRRAA